MKLKILCLTFVQLLMFSSLGYANENCQNGDFWQTWFEKSQFVGFGNPPSTNKVGNAQLGKANQYYFGNNSTKNYAKALELYKKAAN
ncbi:MAG: SEL1-like repeat protein, partial [Methylophilaceae bacterium]|nr:SEL1-like repeat protein [Methylophilaceae bacterium]